MIIHNRKIARLLVTFILVLAYVGFTYLHKPTPPQPLHTLFEEHMEMNHFSYSDLADIVYFQAPVNDQSSILPVENRVTIDEQTILYDLFYTPIKVQNCCVESADDSNAYGLIVSFKDGTTYEYLATSKNIQYRVRKQNGELHLGVDNVINDQNLFYEKIDHIYQSNS
ncbi:hypothetical protein ACE1TH_17220 [Shouchella sp. JSM 1781072]|uniref:hypothetical protein n=1 Tax=Bacillaceae TaxID=186817 RepID=UPI0020D1BB5E|nr:hypothetical protein [Alkalihalobacillus sp. LMS6]UTR06340.1 hypothetical protein MM326_20065 [Alkalihalobacillus sp. LMS6]